MRATFNDPCLQAAFERDGYVVIPWITPDQVARLDRFRRAVEPPPARGFQTDFEREDPAYKAAVDQELREVFQAHVDKWFDGHKAFMSSLLWKWPTPDSDLLLHQDWTYVDESRYRSAAVWCPLVDVDDELDNGPLRVLEGSHAFVPNLRGTLTPTPFEGLETRIAEGHLTAPRVRAGEALVIDNRLLHCSFPNRSGEVRIAAAVAVVPREAELRWVRREADGVDRVFRVDERFFVDNTPQGLKDRRPDGVELIEEHPAESPRVTEEQLLERCPDHRQAGGPAAGDGASIVTRIATAALRANERLLARATDGERPLLDPAAIEGLPELEAEWSTVRGELDDLVAAGRRFPLIEDVLGRDQGNRGGTWRAFVLLAHGRWVDPHRDLLPQTCALLDRIPGLQSALLSILGPGAHLPAHRGPNKGVLRYHLGLRVPEPPHLCRLRVGDELVSHQDGAGVLFDDTVDHEAWNDADVERITLFLEIRRPLRPPLRWANRLTQRTFGLFPEARHALRRVEETEWAVSAPAPR